MGFLCRVAGLSLRDKGAALLHQSKAAEVVWTTDRDPPERLPRHDKLGGDPEADAEPASHLAWECLRKMIVIGG